MARSIEAPFRREFPISLKGILGDSNGIYVGDIKTLHISMNPVNSADGFIEGKIGRDGLWTTIPFTLTEGKTGAIDISEIEYVRFTVTRVDKLTDLNMFGYQEQSKPDILQVELSQADVDRSTETLSTLKDIKKELKRLNTYMHIITGEEI